MRASHALWACEAREEKPVSFSVFSFVPDLLFDCSRVLEYTKMRTVLQSMKISAIMLCILDSHKETEYEPVKRSFFFMSSFLIVHVSASYNSCQQAMFLK